MKNFEISFNDGNGIKITDRFTAKNAAEAIQAFIKKYDITEKKSFTLSCKKL